MRHLLWPAALLFFFISYLRNVFYNLGLFSTRKTSRPVICVGNLTTGGTGKTPWVKKLTDHFQQERKQVTVLSRGYSGDFDGVLRVDRNMDARRCGDEPLWLVRNTRAQVYVGRNRWKAAEKSLAEVETDIFVLDDGFQHRRLERELNIVLLDASAPEYHYWPLPVGRMREPFSALKRADLVVITKCNYGSENQIEKLKTQCARYLPSKRIFCSEFVFSHWSPMVESSPWQSPGKNISVACGVGNPQAFLKTIGDQGYDPVKEFIFPDHYFWKPIDVERMTYNMKVSESRDLLITEKDAVKLQRYTKHFSEMNIQLWICKMKLNLREGDSLFFEQVEEQLS